MGYTIKLLVEHYHPETSMTNTIFIYDALKDEFTKGNTYRYYKNAERYHNDIDYYLYLHKRVYIETEEGFKILIKEFKQMLNDLESMHPKYGKLY